MKNQILEFLQYIGVPATYILTAFSGALLSASQEKKDKQHTMKYTFLRLLTGFSTSLFVTPMIVKFWNLDMSWGYGLSFVLGNTGCILLDILRNLIEGNKDVLVTAIKETIQTWINKVKPKV